MYKVLCVLDHPHPSPPSPHILYLVYNLVRPKMTTLPFDLADVRSIGLLNQRHGKVVLAHGTQASPCSMYMALWLTLLDPCPLYQTTLVLSSPCPLQAGMGADQRVCPTAGWAQWDTAVLPGYRCQQEFASVTLMSSHAAGCVYSEICRISSIVPR